jgi:hypothetical protein
MIAGGFCGSNFGGDTYSDGNCHGESNVNLNEGGLRNLERYLSMLGGICPVRYSDLDSLDNDLFHCSEGTPRV